MIALNKEGTVLSSARQAPGGAEIPRDPVNALEVELADRVLEHVVKELGECWGDRGGVDIGRDEVERCKSDCSWGLVRSTTDGAGPAFDSCSAQSRRKGPAP